MGLFHSNYDKPGPGVRKDEPEKNAFLRFFIIFFRKITQFIELNLLFSVFVVLALAVSYFASRFIPSILTDLIPIMLISPFIAGMTFVTRNYARQEHAFLLSDFFDAVKHNWKAFLANGIVCCFLYFIISVSLRFYFSVLMKNRLYGIAFCLCIAVAFLVISAQYYVPLMIVTFDLKLSQIYKNALIFAIVGLWRNLLLTFLLAALTFVLYLSQIMVLTLILGVVFVFVLYFSVFAFLVNFTIYPLVDRAMIQPYLKKQNTDEEENKN